MYASKGHFDLKPRQIPSNHSGRATPGKLKFDNTAELHSKPTVNHISKSLFSGIENTDPSGCDWY